MFYYRAHSFQIQPETILNCLSQKNKILITGRKEGRDEYF